MEKKTLVLYHGHCMDGLGAALAAYIQLGDDAEFLPCMYGAQPPDLAIFEGRDVYLFDFTFPRAYMDAIAARAHTFVVLDHHVHAAPLLEGTAYGYFDNSKSGAVLAYEHFFGDAPLPKLFQYIQDRDLWTRALPHHEEVTQLIRQHSGEYDDPRTLEKMLWLLDAEDGVTKAAEQGRILRAQVERFIRNDLKRCFVRDVFQPAFVVEGAPDDEPPPVRTVFCTSTPNYVSDLAHEMLGAFPDAEMSCVMFIGNAEHGPAWHHSLRSRQGSPWDVGAFAKMHSGGGHKHSAGFVSPYMLAGPGM